MASTSDRGNPVFKLKDPNSDWVESTTSAVERVRLMAKGYKELDDSAEAPVQTSVPAQPAGSTTELGSTQTATPVRKPRESAAE